MVGYLSMTGSYAFTYRPGELHTYIRTHTHMQTYIHTCIGLLVHMVGDLSMTDSYAFG